MQPLGDLIYQPQFRLKGGLCATSQYKFRTMGDRTLLTVCNLNYHRQVRPPPNHSMTCPSSKKKTLVYRRIKKRVGVWKNKWYYVCAWYTIRGVRFKVCKNFSKCLCVIKFVRVIAPVKWYKYYCFSSNSKVLL